MSRFTTRIELHNATSVDYENLHVAMQEHGFRRTITDDAGVTFYLPWAEYNVEGDFSLESVFNAATFAASAAAPLCKRAILVSEAAARKWDGLAPAA